jgi:hypothetical protein
MPRRPARRSEGSSEDVCGDAVIEEIAQKIGREAHAAQPREIGKLRVDVADGFLNRRDIIIIALNLVHVDQLRWKIAYPKGRERWRLPRRIRNLVAAGETAADEAQSRVSSILAEARPK